MKPLIKRLIPYRAKIWYVALSFDEFFTTKIYFVKKSVMKDKI